MSNNFWYQPRVFSTHKAGEKAGDNQDAYAFNINTKRFAVADGATRSFLSAHWAKLLVNHFCNETVSSNTELLITHDWANWLKPIQVKWNKEVKVIVEKNPKDYVLFNRYEREDPAFATFIGLQFSQINNKSLRWKSIIIGDSCLFILQNDRITSYLLTSPDEFDYRPACFSSVNNLIDTNLPKFQDGYAEIGDTFILATDALAKWMLALSQTLGWDGVIKQLNALESQNDFNRFIRHARQRTEITLENDDTTLMILSTHQSNANIDDSIISVEPSIASTSYVQSTDQLAEQTTAQKGSEETAENASFETPRLVAKSYIGQIKKLKRTRKILLLALLISIILNLLFYVEIYRGYTVIVPVASPDATSRSAVNTPTLTNTVLPEQEVITKTATHTNEPTSTTSLAANFPTPIETPTVINGSITPTVMLPLTPVTPLPVKSLMAGSSIFVSPERDRFLTILTETQANIIDYTDDLKWIKIELIVWVADNEFIDTYNNSISIQTEINAYQKPNSNPANLLGLVESGVSLFVVQEFYDDSNIRWYQVLIQGFSPN